MVESIFSLIKDILGARLFLLALGAFLGFEFYSNFFAPVELQIWRNGAQQTSILLAGEAAKSGVLVGERDDLNRRVQSLNTQFEKTKLQVETLQTARTQLETENAGLKQQVSSLNTTLTGIRNSMEGLQKEIEAQKAKTKLNTQAIPSEIR